MKTSAIGFYTKEEVMQILGVAESTIYGLVRKGILEPEILPETVKRAKMYTKASVAAYKRKYKPDLPPGAIRLSDFAKKENISLSRLYDLTYRIGELGTVQVGERDVAYLTEEQQKQILHIVEKKNLKVVKTGFYNKKYDVALYQLFYEYSEKKKYRVVLNDENEWGLKASDTPFIPLEKAFAEMDIDPAYELGQGTIKGKAYVTFNVEKGSNTLEEMLDFFYQFHGVKNMHISFNENTNCYSIAVKENVFEFSTLFNYNELEWLVEKMAEVIEDGEVTLAVQDNVNRKPFVLTVKLKDVFVATRVSKKVHIKLMAYAESEGIALNKAVSNLLKGAVKNLDI